MREDDNGFFKMSSSCAKRFLVLRRVRTSAASTGWLLGSFLPRIELLGVDIPGASGDQRGAAFAGQAQGFGAEGRVVLAVIIGFQSFLHDDKKIPLYSAQVYPTASRYPVQRLCRLGEVPASGYSAWQQTPQQAMAPRAPNWKAALVKTFEVHKRCWGTHRLRVLLRQKSPQVWAVSAHA